MHSDLGIMKKSYEDTVRRLTLDSNVQNYKMYLLGFFAVCEYFGGGILGFDMQGLTEFQLTNMNAYERLLIELGEKSKPDQKPKFSVEVRLIGVAFINIVFFVIAKIIMNKTGVNVLTLFKGINNQTAPVKKKMKSPNIVFDEENKT